MIVFPVQESDREKLHLARQRHALEERQSEADALKEKRKEERAAKRAARKEAASQALLGSDLQVPEAAVSLPQPVSRSRVTVGSTSASR